MKNLLGKTVIGMLFSVSALITTASFAQDNSGSSGTRPEAPKETGQNPLENRTVSSPDDNITGTVKNEPATKQEPVKAEEKVTAPKSLTIASWGGAYMQAQQKAYFSPWQKDTGLVLNSEKHAGNYETIKSNLAGSGQKWDLVDLSYNMVDQACDAGLIEPISPEILEPAPGGASASEDFFRDGIHKCGVASMVWSLAIIYNKQAFGRAMPTTASDFFNVRKYKGKRTLPKTAEDVLELALLADGAKPEEIYPLLETEEGVERAFKELDAIKKNIIWWTSPAEPFELVADGKADFGIGYNGRAFAVIAEQKKPLGIIWDGQIYHYNLWSIPKNASNKEDALRFITYATNPKRLALQSSWFPYGPSRQSATGMITDHPEAGIDLTPFIPTVPQNFKLALRKDMKWWDTNRTRLQARFERWLRDEPEPLPEPDASPARQTARIGDKPVIAPPKEEPAKENEPKDSSDKPVGDQKKQ